MLALALTMLSLAPSAPVRGSTMIELNGTAGTFFLAGRSLNFNAFSTLGSCANQLFQITSLQNSPSYDVFPSDSRIQFQGTTYPISIHLSNQGLSGACPYGVERRPTTGFRFLARGPDPWVAWNDTVLSQDTLQSGSGWVRQLRNIRIHWVWSAYDSTHPWVRWTDTLDQASGSGAPLLTMTKSVRVDSIVPASAPSVSGARRIALQVQYDSARSWSMSFDGVPSTTAPAGAFPAGTNLRLDSRVSSSGPDPFLCRIWSGGRVLDSVMVRPAPPVGISARPHRHRTFATGRSFDAEGRTLPPTNRSDIVPNYRNPAPRDRPQSRRESMQSP